MEYFTYEKPEEYWKKKSKKLKIHLIVQVLFGIPKSLLFNLHYFGLKGIKLPILISPRTKLKKLHGRVSINSKYKT